MDLARRIALMVQLGAYLREEGELLQAYLHRTQYHNAWFTLENQLQAIRAISNAFLTREALEDWVNSYSIPTQNEPQKIGLVLAGNIPLVGFHDILSCFIAGHTSLIKLSEKDPYVLPHLIEKLISWEPAAATYFQLVQKLTQQDAVIATGSNNSARYFETYFGKYPHIIRRNRNAVAVLRGQETREQLVQLGKDIFSYFGLGCRNVSKLLVPRGYDFDPLLEALHDYREMVLHTKYKNNFDYNFALFSLNKKPFLANGSVMITEDPSLQSRIAVLHYECYEGEQELEQLLRAQEKDIQVVVGKVPDVSISQVGFGEAQQPGLTDYADGVDTMEFLLNL